MSREQNLKTIIKAFEDNKKYAFNFPECQLCRNQT